MLSSNLYLYVGCTVPDMFPVKAAAELSGLTPETLRAWERRHGAVVPHRDEQGRRLYDAAMVDRLTRLHRLTNRGHPIRDLAALDDAALDGIVASITDGIDVNGDLHADPEYRAAMARVMAKRAIARARARLG